MYNYFACRYDELTENADYEARANYIVSFFEKYGIKKGSTILDLACGTGTMSLLLSDMDYDVIGVDSSADMLTVAENRTGGKIPLILADMRDFFLPEPVYACMCNLDSLNHLKDIGEVKKAFNCVYKSLRSGGIFIFDLNTVYKHNHVLENNCFVFDRDDFFLSWDNELLDDSTVRIMLDFFVFNGKNYDRYSEEIIERAYETDVVVAALKQYFDLLGVYDDLTLDKPHKTSERLYYVCKRK